MCRFNRFVVFTLVFFFTSSASAVVTFDWITIGDPGNPSDPNFNACGSLGALVACGSVAQEYRIGRYEVTAGQYTEFLNAVDPEGTNSLTLYLNFGGNDPGMVLVPANPSGSKYVVKAGFDNKPVTLVFFGSMLRFANWMHNGQGSGDTETGAYTLEGGTTNPTNLRSVTRNPDAQFFLPNEHEWYKAAYYDLSSGTYLTWPYADDTSPTCAAPPGGNTHSSNCDNAVGGVTDIGSYSTSAGINGTFDQGGNVTEWTETIFSGDPFYFRKIHGGDFQNGPTVQGAFSTGAINPRQFAFNWLGFRLAAPSGDIEPENPAEPVPSLMNISAIFLALLLGIGGVLSIRRWNA